nr:MAG: RNA-dependent RNA polymerase [brine shrimp partiti-like virus 4]UNI73918.1 MAG: RNA-dependent RNA polymerase [brine shrimp partiti-like virus 4]UNI73919.1 MAG: RNA-dependent RNA polymerase [brine shrimp partiti-like virus 4]
MSKVHRMHPYFTPKHSVSHLTRVKPHMIDREAILTDPFVEDTLKDMYGPEFTQTFQGYSRSFYTLEGHYANIASFDRPITSRPVDPLYYAAIESTRNSFLLDEKVKPLSWYDLKSVPFIPSSSAGYGYTGKKGDPGNLDTAVSRAVASLYTWRDDSSSFKYTPDLAFTRTQLASLESPKIRHVWGRAFHNILIEGITAAPLMKAYQIRAYPMPIGRHLYKYLPEIIRNTLIGDDEPQLGIGLDVRQFDASAQPWIINDAFAILRENINFDYEPETQLTWEYSKYFFITTPVVMPDGHMWLKRLGVPSGSYFTQLIDSIINHILVNYIQLKTYGQTFPTWVLGDDSLFGLPSSCLPVRFDTLVHHARTLGFELHPDKSIVTSDPKELEFLGHVARGSRIHRDEIKMMRLALYTEYPVSTPELSLARVRGLLVDSALNNWPLLHLNDLMTIRYHQAAKNLQFEPLDRHWLQNVLNLSEAPADIDVIKAFCLT